MTVTPPPAVSPTPRRIRGQGWLVVPGLMAALPALVATGLRVLPPGSERLAKAASFIPYGLLFWVPATLLLGVATLRALRHRTPGRPSLAALSLLSIAGLAATMVWHAPAFVADSGRAATKPLTIVSLNVARTAKPEAVARAAHGADVVVLVEAYVTWASSLPASFRAEFPYRAPVDAATSDRMNADVVIFSRHPIATSEPLPKSSFQQWSAVVRTPQLGPVRVVGVHPCNPYCRQGLWVDEAGRLRAWLADHQKAMQMIIAGDFNAVDDHLTMQGLYADGYRSAADLAGAGFVRTWPADRRFPPVIAIDHVLLTPGLTATGFDTFDVPGTDHLGIRTEIARVAT
ncbi:MAG: endonuclease/exonuclease/phosphatase family protein [Micropruina sp.]|uniref:endonuclease/exonuclease/phosphatase family protein n=1 Tax=Micropruina sp. TaxID=2737536 RepID=UPI0039E5D476